MQGCNGQIHNTNIGCAVHLPVTQKLSNVDDAKVKSTLSFESTTPPLSLGSIEAVPIVSIMK